MAIDDENPSINRSTKTSKDEQDQFCHNNDCDIIISSESSDNDDDDDDGDDDVEKDIILENLPLL